MRAVPPAESAGGADPEIVIPIFEERLNAVVAQSVGDCESGGLPLDETHDALIVGAEPECAVVVLECSANAKRVGGRRQFSRVDPAVRVLEDPTRDGRKPQIAAMAAVNRRNIVPGEPVAAVYNVDIRGAHSHQPIGRTNPDTVLAILQDR